MCKALVQFRAKSGKTQAEMAAEIGVSQAAYCRYEAGDRVPRRTKMARLVEVTGGTVLPTDFYSPSPEAAS